MPKQKPGKSKQDYVTPDDFLDAVKRRLKVNWFYRDLAARADNAKATRWITPEENSLVTPWDIPIDITRPGFILWQWLNPEFGRIAPWAKRCFDYSKTEHVALLTPASVGANWWRDYVDGTARVLLLNGRITFVGEEAGYPKDCTLSLFGPTIVPGYEVWTWPTQK